MGFETSIPIVNFGPSLPLKTPATPSEAVKKQGVFVVWVVKGGTIQKSIMEITEPQKKSTWYYLGIRDLFQKKSIPKTATRWSNSWWTTRWMTLLLPVCVLQRLKFRSQYYDVATSVSWIPKRWLFETFFVGH